MCLQCQAKSDASVQVWREKDINEAVSMGGAKTKLAEASLPFVTLTFRFLSTQVLAQHSVLWRQHRDIEVGPLTYCAVGGEVRLDGGRVVLWDTLVVAGRDLERRPLGTEAEVDHRPAAEKKEQEEGEREQETPGLTAGARRRCQSGFWGLGGAGDPRDNRVLWAGGRVQRIG